MIALLSLAAAVPATPATLSAWLAVASERSPRPKRAAAASMAARASRSAAGVLPRPRLAYAYAPSPVETRLGPQRHRLGVEQPVPWPTRLDAAGDAARARSEAARADRARVLRDVARGVGRAYVALWRARVRVELTEALRATRARGLAALRGAVSALELSPAALSRAELALARTEARLEALAGARREAEIALRAQAGLPAEGEAHAPGLPPALTAAAPAAPGARAPHPRLVAAEARARAAAAARREAEASRLPNFVVRAAWLEIGELPSQPESGRDALSLELGIELPVWWGAEAASGRAAAARAEAEDAETRAEQLELDALRARLEVRAEAAAKTLAALETEAIPAAERYLATVRGELAAGRVAYQDVVDAEDALLEARLRAADARASLARARFERLALDLDPAALARRLGGAS